MRVLQLLSQRPGRIGSGVTLAALARGATAALGHARPGALDTSSFTWAGVFERVAAVWNDVSG